MMELIIVRHGETDSNVKKALLGITDEALNENGLKQAKIAAKKLGKLKIDSIYSSPLKRAAATAEIIKNQLDDKSDKKEDKTTKEYKKTKLITYSDYLKERNFGKWDGMTLDEIKQSYPEEYEMWMKDAEFCAKNAESVSGVKKRIKSFLSELCSFPYEGTHIIVTHLGCIRYMIAFLLELPDEYSWRFRVDNGSLTKVQINNEGYAFLTMLNG
jgi:alpha-ribazole phosphatase